MIQLSECTRYLCRMWTDVFNINRGSTIFSFKNSVYGYNSQRKLCFLSLEFSIQFHFITMTTEWRNSLLQCQSVYFLKRLNFFLRSSAWHGFISPCPCTVLSSSGRVVGSLVSDRIRHRTRQGTEDSPHCYHRRRWQPATLNSLLTCNYAEGPAIQKMNA